MRLVKLKPAFENQWQMIGFIVFSLFIFCLPFLQRSFGIDRSFLFQYSTTENADLPFFRKEIFEKTEPVDWLFVGPCTVWWHIHPEIIAEEVAKASGKKVTALNLGYNHFGSEVSALLLKDFLAHRSVRNVVLATPRFNDGLSFPHPDSHQWWLYGQDSDLLQNVRWRDRFSLYSASVMGSLTHFNRRIFNPPPITRPTPLNDQDGSKILPSKEAHIPYRDLQSPPRERIWSQKNSNVIKPVSSQLQPTEKKLFIELVQRLQSQGIRVWLLSSPLKEDLNYPGLREVADWFEIFGNSVQLIGIPTEQIRQAYNSDELELSFEGENFSPAFTPIYSRWIGQAIGAIDEK